MVLAHNKNHVAWRRYSNREGETNLLTRHVVLRNQFCSSIGGIPFWRSAGDDEMSFLIKKQEILPLGWIVVLSYRRMDIAGAVLKDFEYAALMRRSEVRTSSGAGSYYTALKASSMRTVKYFLLSDIFVTTIYAPTEVCFLPFSQRSGGTNTAAMSNPFNRYI
jgi:hypothetical protein